MHWIKIDDKLERVTTRPNGDAFFVDESGSKAIISGKLYINGRLADEELVKIGEDEYVLEGGKIIDDNSKSTKTRDSNTK